MPLSVCLVGIFGVGKTLLSLKIAGKDFPDTLVPTSDCTFLVWTPEGRPGLEIYIWDTAGMEQYQPLMQLHYRDKSLALFVFDVTERASLSELEPYHRRFRAVNTEARAILVANKCDVEEDPDHQFDMVTQEEMENWANEHGCVSYCIVSAFRGDGLEDLKDQIVEQVSELQPQVSEPAGVQITADRTDRLEESRGCCSRSTVG
jgi:small GTP-binding protein